MAYFGLAWFLLIKLYLQAGMVPACAINFFSENILLTHGGNVIF
jgi:hypothetical protein